MSNAELVDWARSTARNLLADSLPRRWKHVQGVAATANRIRKAVGADGEVLVASAWLHDIGYSPEVKVTGFHPIDGASYLQTQELTPRLCALVARHSGAVHEGALRDLKDAVEGFPDEQTAARNALWYCDMTSGPDGQALSINDRLDDIRMRYGTEHLVSRAISAAEEDLRAAVESTEQLMQAHGLVNMRA